jgi:hypothetical protein
MCATAPMTFGQWTCAFAIEGSGFIKGGNQLWEYKPLHDQWYQRATFPGVSTGGSSAFAIQQHGYVTSGYVGGLSVVTDQVWSFHPATNSWKQEIEFAGSSRRFPVAFAIHDRGYIGTGTNGINFNDFWQFNPTDNSIGLAENVIDVKVYPNPVVDEVHIQCFGFPFDQLELTIFDMNGKLLLKEDLLYFQQDIDVTALKTGTYILKIGNSSQILHQQKVLKR